jgi:hypothetical protein
MKLRLKRTMSPWNKALSIEQLQAEIRHLIPDAVHRSIEIRNVASKDINLSRFLKRINLERFVLDISSASLEEMNEYQNWKRERQSYPPDETWHFIVKQDESHLLHELSIFDAQTLSLGYSSASDEEAWRNAWGSLKVTEDMNRSSLRMLLSLMAMGLGLIIFKIVL